ncbi:CAAX protease family protein [Companilactobacillus allii]|uniref:CAAX protease family protein n=1 Tax=Companilactobacillus allii TaxID=1847728 RepID=A0A1P8Q048_9LACO|nr:CPBP family glutamic-type intramembrane protease [Companilactobacillus allii]APX71252.1 CAAX protease family protein [Companilactobacillus allii]USQ68333.1 CAAX protease family protein [Companilactobacillus allii]
MRVGESPRIDLVRYLIWIIFSVITLSLKNITATDKGLNIILMIIFFAVGIVFTFLMTRRYLRERRSFSDNPTGFMSSLISNIGLVTLMIILVCALRLMVSYLQVTGKLPSFQNDDVASSDQKVFIFNMIANIFIIAIQQQLVQTGFFFNYFFRKSTAGNAVIGIVLSGVIGGLISLPGSLLQFFMMMALGWCYALTYLYTQDEKMAMLVGLISAIVGTILI